VKLDINKIISSNDETPALMEIYSELNLLSNYGEDLSKLTESQKSFLMIENLEGEVNNGG
jgi:hypothetical protein